MPWIQAQRSVTDMQQQTVRSTSHKQTWLPAFHKSKLHPRHRDTGMHIHKLLCRQVQTIVLQLFCLRIHCCSCVELFPTSAAVSFLVHSWCATTGEDDYDMEPEPPFELWSGLSQRLRDNGFAGLPLLSEAASQSPGHARGPSQSHGPHAPSPEALYTALDSVLMQYNRRAQLVQELLSATDMARERESHVDDLIRSLRR